MTLDQVIAGITPADTAAMERAKARWDSIAKPLGSWGRWRKRSSASPA